MIRGRTEVLGVATALLLLSSAILSPLRAQAVEGRLSLNDAILLARRHNPAFLSTENDQGPADWNVREAYGLFLPNVNTSISGNYLAPDPRLSVFSTPATWAWTSRTTISPGTVSLHPTHSWAAPSFGLPVRGPIGKPPRLGSRLHRTIWSRMSGPIPHGPEGEGRGGGCSEAVGTAEQNFELADARVDVGAVTPTDGKQAELERGRAKSTSWRPRASSEPRRSFDFWSNWGSRRRETSS